MRHVKAETGNGRKTPQHYAGSSIRAYLDIKARVEKRLSLRRNALEKFDADVNGSSG